MRRFLFRVVVLTGGFSLCLPSHAQTASEQLDAFSLKNIEETATAAIGFEDDASFDGYVVVISPKTTLSEAQVESLASDYADKHICSQIGPLHVEGINNSLGTVQSHVHTEEFGDRSPEFDAETGLYLFAVSCIKSGVETL